MSVPPTNGAAELNLGEIRARLSRERGQQYWRSLEEIAETPAFREMLHREFPKGASEWWDSLDRRTFLKMAAATMALAGLNACTKQPAQEIVPYVKEPNGLRLGQPLYYATSMVLGGFATGILAKSREGHPIKIDGNPDHPDSPSGSTPWMQASILDLYDPDRSQSVTRGGELSTWAHFLAELNALLAEEQPRKGAGLRFLSETISSPTLAAQIDDLQQQFPGCKWVQYDPITRDNVREGAALAFGEFVETHYRFDRANVILSLESDFLYSHPQRLLYTQQFIDGRRVSLGRREMNRLYLVESTPSITGTMADHRLPLASGAIESLAREIARQLGVEAPLPAEPVSAAQAPFISAAVEDLKRHRGAGLVIAGEWQPARVHALAHVLNHALGNVDQTLFYTASAEARPLNQLQAMGELVREMRDGAVSSLFILGGNPVYTAPAELEFARHLARVKRSIHLGVEFDDTAAGCTWHIPQSHYLESWGDARAFDGTVSLLQPLIDPLYGGKSAHELLDALSQPSSVRSDYEIVRGFWQKQNRWPDFDQGWRQALHDGFIAGTQLPRKVVQIKAAIETSAAFTASQAGSAPLKFTFAPDRGGTNKSSRLTATPTRKLVQIDNVEVCFRPDPSLWDGRFANNGWLQECPKPVTKLTWDNAVLVSPALAQRAQLKPNDVVELQLSGRTIRGPIWIVPGQAESSLTIHLGFGRAHVGRVGRGVGFNAFAVRASNAFWSASGARLVATGEAHPLVATQTHHSLHSPERQIYRAVSLQDLRQEPDVVKRSVEAPERDQTLYNPREYPYDGYRWGMSIDLNACIGCNACVVACEVENNIPVVGKDQVAKNREMLWLRVDTYYGGELDNPTFGHVPVPCMHCEHAPCELVCPVEAAVHDREGLNLQIYQRCIGTRFCSNNCPYKVRRFNFLRYTDYETPSLKPMYNPEVTVRWRGVMEKCTYCVQRIAQARITAEKENRRIRDGEVRTACQEACPATAIVFGDLNGPGSKVAQLKAQPLDYSMLGQLNTRPRTTYLAKVENRNPEIQVVPPSDQPQDA